MVLVDQFNPTENCTAVSGITGGDRSGLRLPIQGPQEGVGTGLSRLNWVVSLAYILVYCGCVMLKSKHLHRLETWFLLAALVPLGLFTRYYDGWAADFVNYSLGGVIYVTFWCLLVSLIFPGAPRGKVCGWVVVITSLLECLQLWHPPWLEQLRSSLAGQMLLGTTFVWTDFIGYLAGGFIAWFWFYTVEQPDY
jgi:hypothetical protein